MNFHLLNVQLALSSKDASDVDAYTDLAPQSVKNSNTIVPLHCQRVPDVRAIGDSAADLSTSAPIRGTGGPRHLRWGS